MEGCDSLVSKVPKHFDYSIELIQAIEIVNCMEPFSRRK